MAALTVFTPTYNRANLLWKCYRSLQRQSSKDFIWLIVDDGSTDETAEIVRGWIDSEEEFEIRYVYKENGGLHTGYNKAIEMLDTELAVCVDSDDYLADDAVTQILEFWRDHGTENMAGIAALDCDPNGKIIGDPFPAQPHINLIDLLAGKYPIRNGDRKLIVRSDLYKKVAPQKTFSGEKNFNPHYMHLQISENYDFLVLNEPLCVVEYQAEGMTAGILKQYRNSPNSFAETRKLYLSFPNTSLKFRFRHSVHFVSSCILAGKTQNAIKGSPRKLLAMLAFPFGWLLSRYILIKTR